jgi:hypothetical protein
MKPKTNLKVTSILQIAVYKESIIFPLINEQNEKNNNITNQSQRSRDHIKEKVAPGPLKPSRTTA